MSVLTNSSRAEVIESQRSELRASLRRFVRCASGLGYIAETVASVSTKGDVGQWKLLALRSPQCVRYMLRAIEVFKPEPRTL